MTGFQLPVPPCAHQTLLELKAASTKSGCELEEKGEHKHTDTKTWLFAAAAAGLFMLSKRAAASSMQRDHSSDLGHFTGAEGVKKGGTPQTQGALLSVQLGW